MRLSRGEELDLSFASADKTGKLLATTVDPLGKFLLGNSVRVLTSIDATSFSEGEGGTTGLYL